MKIRKGFVSNSSSSSFCIYGTQFESLNDLLTALKKMGSLTQQQIYDNVNEALTPETPITNEEELTELIYDYGGSEVVDAVFSSDILGVYTGSEYNEDMISIGREWCSIGDKETGEEFRQGIEAEVKALFGSKVKCSSIEESYRC